MSQSYALALRQSSSLSSADGARRFVALQAKYKSLVQRRSSDALVSQDTDPVVFIAAVAFARGEIEPNGL